MTLGLIAGNGRFPFLVLDAARSLGHDITIVAVKEEAESKLLEGYMPAGASEEEIDAAVAEALAETGATSAKQMGLVVKAAQAKLTGKRVDGKALADKVKGKLS